MLSTIIYKETNSPPSKYMAQHYNYINPYE